MSFVAVPPLRPLGWSEFLVFPLHGVKPCPTPLGYWSSSPTPFGSWRFVAFSLLRLYGPLMRFLGVTSALHAAAPYVVGVLLCLLRGVQPRPTLLLRSERSERSEFFRWRAALSVQKKGREREALDPW